MEEIAKPTLEGVKPMQLSEENIKSLKQFWEDKDFETVDHDNVRGDIMAYLDEIEECQKQNKQLTQLLENTIMALVIKGENNSALALQKRLNSIQEDNQ